ncbi:hypothetical protein CLO_1883 [Clostridium botulinum E1 str. 'BoNT E Beluga']|nr:hypothetical protein CLO_1883 [Clostridium botulinum E1 str. 'BoNT E Beluga']
MLSMFILLLRESVRETREAREELIKTREGLRKFIYKFN